MKLQLQPKPLKRRRQLPKKVLKNRNSAKLKISEEPKDEKPADDGDFETVEVVEVVTDPPTTTTTTQAPRTRIVKGSIKLLKDYPNKSTLF